MRHLILDFDGTLFHLPVDYAALRRELDLPEAESLGDAYQRFLDVGDSQRLAIVTRYEVAAIPHGCMTDGAAELIARAEGQIAVVTRNSRIAVLEALGEASDNILVIGREDVTRLKPDPEGLEIAIRHFDCPVEEVVVIGDTSHDVAAGRAVGAFIVIVDNPAVGQRPAGADWYVSSLTDERIANL